MRIVIIGAGFAGLTLAKRLCRLKAAQVQVLDRQNHHLFQPLLYQVATAALTGANIAVPIRHILRDDPRVEVALEEVVGVDRAGKAVLCQSARRYAYDVLIVATGARHSYFGHPEWEHFAPGLKTVEDALRIRQKILTAFEKAELASAEEQTKLLTFVLVGGGPTGVEMAGAIAELARKTLPGDFRHVGPELARVYLVEAAPRILGTFEESLGAYAEKSLRRMGVEVLKNALVTQIDAGGVTYKEGGAEKRITTHNVIWTAGVQASPAAKWLAVEADRSGRVPVNDFLQLPDDPNIFVLGDTAAVKDEAGKPLPGVASVAMQEGRYVADLLCRRMKNPTAPSEPFRYRNKGYLATIGRSSAIADLGRFHLTGFVAWLLWCFVHIAYLIDFRNRIIVMLEWFWAYVSFRRGARILTDESIIDEATGPRPAEVRS